MKKVFLVILVLLLIPLKINALTGTFGFTCDEEKLKSEGIITCSLIGQDFEKEISSLHTELVITPSDTWHLKDITIESIWEGSGENGIIDIYTDANKKGTFPIAKITLTTEEYKKLKTKELSLFVKTNNTLVGDKNFKENNLSSESSFFTVWKNGVSINGNQNAPNNNQNNDGSQSTENNAESNPHTGISINIIQLLVLFIIGIIIRKSNKRKLFKI